MIKSLNFHIRRNNQIKIQKIENLNKFEFLEELNLSYNVIEKIENLQTLGKLRDLNLSENRIKKIEGLV
jgi:centriolin